MELMNKVMANITGVTLGALFFIAGELCFSDPSIVWMKNLFVFLGLFIAASFVIRAFAQYVEIKDPNFGAISSIEERQVRSKNASNAGKARSHDIMAIVFAVMVIAFSVLKAPRELLAILLAGYVIQEGTALYFTFKEFEKLRSK